MENLIANGLSLNEWKLAWCLGVSLIMFLKVAILSSYIVQAAWAWIDDAKMNWENWVIRKVSFTKFKYAKTDNYSFVYYHTKKDAIMGEGEEGVDYVRWHDDMIFGPVGCNILLLIFGLFFGPILLLILFKMYAVTLIVSLSFGTAFLARFTRRLQKKLFSHIDDKTIHRS